MKASSVACVGGGVGELGAAVAELAHEEPGERVEVALALRVPDVGALAAHDHRHVGVVVGRVPGEVHPEVVAGGLLELVVVERHAGPSCGPRSAPRRKRIRRQIRG